ncbi:MAG: motility associated factor glycosyltransferase family protein [Leptospiraceae bacterium]|nr:motility associated factor glycosyltransferase family protein [Leptospiraceae bacterium]
MSLKKFAAEIESLFSRKPYLKLYFSHETSGKYLLLDAKKENEYFLSLNAKPLASSISPSKQAERQVQEKEIPPNHLILLLGLGNPHLIHELHKRMRPGQILILIDEDWESVPALWEVLGTILEVPGRHVFAGENSLSLLWNYLESLPFDKITGISYYRNQSNLALNKEYYLTIEERANKLFSSKMSDLLTKFEFERIWVKNTILNTLNFDSQTPRYKISELEGKFSGYSAALISAGPSLRSQCELIKKNRDKLFIFSCDTSLKVLLKFGIIPDGVMTLDAQTNSYFHFMGESLEQIPLFADMVTSPMLLRSLNFSSVVHSQTAKFQIDAAGKPVREGTAGSEFSSMYLGNIGDVQSGGSVATSAFDLLRFMGFQKVFLFGQDLAYTGREIHSTGTHHNEKWLTKVDRTNSLERINEVIVRKRETSFIDSNDSGKVLSDYVLNIYRHWFEESVKQIQFEAININDKGAKIEGMQTLSLKESEKYFENLPDHNDFWKELSIWKKDPIPNYKIDKLEIKNELLKSLNILLKLMNNYEKSHLDSKLIIENIKLELEHRTYLKSMIRKSEIYLKRHSDLDEDRKLKILFTSIRKEIRFIKIGLFSIH